MTNEPKEPKIAWQTTLLGAICVAALVLLAFLASRRPGGLVPALVVLGLALVLIISITVSLGRHKLSREISPRSAGVAPFGPDLSIGLPSARESLRRDWGYLKIIAFGTLMIPVAVVLTLPELWKHRAGLVVIALLFGYTALRIRQVIFPYRRYEEDPLRTPRLVCTERGIEAPIEVLGSPFREILFSQEKRDLLVPWEAISSWKVFDAPYRRYLLQIDPKLSGVTTRSTRLYIQRAPEIREREEDLLSRAATRLGFAIEVYQSSAFH